MSLEQSPEPKVRAILEESVGVLEASSRRLGQLPLNEDVVVNYLVRLTASVGSISRDYLRLNPRTSEFSRRILLRSLMEAYIKMDAVTHDPGLILRIAASENEDDRKWARVLNDDRADNHEQTLRILEDSIRRFHPESQTSTRPLNTRGLAERINRDREGALKGYDTFYRLYCRYSHLNVSALIDHFNDVEVYDDRAALISVAKALEVHRQIGAPSADFDPIFSRTLDLLDCPPQP